MTMDVFSFVIVGVYVLSGGLVLSLLVLGLIVLLKVNNLLDLELAKRVEQKNENPQSAE
ncbi:MULTISPECIES: hypothetical protein [Brevibacterium]|uniref:Uncharacterized protein n=4 Tax=Brevibacterium TaxID=1696 RepID=A0A2H1KS27_BREAU|nr:MULTISPECIES: hypothetical protein [Brevibacterium]SMY02481.1 hypothetical protein BAUR9175_03786 [Brevibacterium aurantiacum]SMY03070.1 hypothetical protein BANT10_03477 [Brevibacterium antiquum]SMY05157.1 hypothetical protein BAURA86_03966 [Brevibacterium aurantiacum]SMY05370.1 hypothetical protein BANT918_03394 [Brevibacterium antiquum CNRZ 918]GEB24999.1 hypothetical protein BAU01nite_37320 [Brevibacterium aurantiacum]